MLLLQECWKDLFLLHLCQWSVAWDISHLLTARAATLSPGIETEVRAVLEIISRYLKVLETSRTRYWTPSSQVPWHAARPNWVRMHEDHRPVQAGDGGPWRAAECGGSAGPGSVHPRWLRQEQIHQPANQVRSEIQSVTDNLLFYFFRLVELNKCYKHLYLGSVDCSWWSLCSGWSRQLWSKLYFSERQLEKQTSKI